MKVDTIVVGNGLIGSAAARYLAALGENVALIGQAEPLDPSTHDGVFASHYDQRRITHVTGRSPIWMTVNQEAIKAYTALEQESGVTFYDPVGYLNVLPPHLYEAEDAPQRLAARLQIPHTFFPAGDRSWRDQFPEYDFPETHAVLFEHAPAGAINPRAMREAENIVATRLGATIMSDLIVAVSEQPESVAVTTRGGERHEARKVVLATGAFTNSFELLPRKLALNPKTEVVVLGEVAPGNADQLKRLPTVSYKLDDPEIMEVYMTPTAPYADGRQYVKLGANSIYDTFTDDLGDMQAWFKNGSTASVLPPLRTALTTIMPDTTFLSFASKRCMITRTASTYPMIDQISERIVVAVGGNGGSAQCAGVWGRMAAELSHHGHWTSSLPQDPFRARLKGTS